MISGSGMGIHFFVCLNQEIEILIEKGDIVKNYAEQ